MKKQEVIRRLCALVTEVGSEVFAHKYAHDCICDVSRPQYESYVENDTNMEKYKRVDHVPLDCCYNVDLAVVDERVIEFIEDAVRSCSRNCIEHSSLHRDNAVYGHIPAPEEE